MTTQPLKIVLFFCVLLFGFSDVLSQTTRRRGTQRTSPKASPAQPAATPTPVPSATPAAPRVPRQPIRLAILNGQTITTSDLDPQVAQAVESLDQKIEDARRRVLEMQINTMLLEAEARKRNVRTQQIYEQEVTKRVVNPSEAEIKKFIEENSGELEGAGAAEARARVLAFLRSEKEEALSAELVKRLRNSHPVVMGASLNSPNLAPSAVVVTVAGRPVTAATLQERLKPVIFRLQLAAYDLQMNALDRTINNLLLLAEANKRNVGPETIVRAEVSDKVKSPTDADVNKFYEENKSKLNGDLNSIRNQLVSYLESEQTRRLEKELADRLRKGADIRYLVTEPQAPVQLVNVDDDPTRGPATAPVTIVEFTDFQCPSCAAMHPIIEEALKSYGDKVRFVVRDFPLDIHANAYKAAEAANAAHAQGKFFEYVSILFKRQNALDVASLKKYATELGLDRTKFDLALDKGGFAPEIAKDIQEGEMYGVEATPTLFINGRMLMKLSAEGLREAIDRALAAPAAKPAN